MVYIADNVSQAYVRLRLYKYGAFIDDLYVSPEFRHKGIAKQLIDEAKLWATNKGVHEIHLAVAARNEAAVQLYESAGFEQQPSEYLDYKLELKP